MTRPKHSDRADYLIELCRGKRVLHLGCADEPFTEARIQNGTLLHGLISEVAERCCGVDTSESALAILRRHGYEDLLAGSIEDLVTDGKIAGDDFEIVLAAEVLEHVSDAGTFLSCLKPLLTKPASRLIITTPNAYCAYRFAYTMLTGRERGHPDHVAQYSTATLRQLLSRYDLEIETASFYSGREYLGRDYRQRLFVWIDRIAYCLRPQLGDGLIACCKAI